MDVIVKKQRPKVLFIIHDVYQEDNFFPVGPGYLCAVLLQAGCDVQVYPMDVFHYTNNQLADHLEGCNYDLICCGFLAARFKETIIGLAETVNKFKKNAWFVLGGHGPSPIADYMLKVTGAALCVNVIETLSTLEFRV